MENLTRILNELRSTIQRIGGGGHDGDDLFGEVALACIEKQERYDWSHPLIKGRIIRIAKNLRVKFLRRERLRRHAPLPSDEHADVGGDDCPIAIEHEKLSSAQYEEAIGSLSDSYRHVIHERFTKGKRLTAIAEELNVPSATVRTRCHRALRQLASHPVVARFGSD